MNRLQRTVTWSVIAVAILVICWLGFRKAQAHCDSVDGPVITEAKAALADGDVTPMLKWVPKKYEREIRNAFARTVAIRTKGKDVRDLADRSLKPTSSMSTLLRESIIWSQRGRHTATALNRNTEILEQCAAPAWQFARKRNDDLMIMNYLSN